MSLEETLKDFDKWMQKINNIYLNDAVEMNKAYNRFISTIK